MRTIRTLDELAAIVARSERALYVRYSRGPIIDRRNSGSVNHQTGRLEAGLSCNCLTPEPWWPVNGRTVHGWVAMQVRDYSYLRGQDTRAWVLSGREVGRGSDNEPVVADWRPVAWIDNSAVEEALSAR